MLNHRLLLIIFIGFIAFIQPMTLLSATNDYYKNPKLILQEVSKRGAKTIVFELYNYPEEWNYILHHIASGKINWLKVAVALHPGTDAGASESLSLSVGEALENNPLNVFQIALPEFELAYICSGPDVDDQRYNSYELAIDAINRRQKKIASITDPRLKEVCAKGIQLLEEAKVGIKRFFNPESKENH